MTIVTLSFDNGPDPDVTPHVLDTVRRHHIQSTFFVLGHKLRDHRKLAERAHAEGHWIGNHTYNHIVPLGSSIEEGFATSEIERTEQLIGDLAHARRFFRPFGGGVCLARACSIAKRSDIYKRTSTPAFFGMSFLKTGCDPEAGLNALSS
jgi:peptidoglycan/xylan/chitin deacetylase (PgdA/CDA1 family)